MSRTPEESFDGLLIEADWMDMHGGDHHDDDCEVCRDIANVRAALALVPTSAQGAQVQQALQLAVNIIMASEPGDSRAVSNEAVALAAVSCGDTSEPVMKVVRDALAVPSTPAQTVPDDQRASEDMTLAHNARKTAIEECNGVDIPDGWALVPIEPTNAMLKAACAAMSPAKRPTPDRVSSKEKHRIRYQAMISAAPSSLVPSTHRETLIGRTNFCGHGMMAAICPTCSVSSTEGE